jgi:GNAT superfamily N-acetyltransferase
LPLTLVTRTYLEMTSREDLKAEPAPKPAPAVARLEPCPVELFRELYAEVGQAFHWTDRLSWTDDAIRRHLENPAISVWLMLWQDKPAGYFELREHDDGSVEIAYFGLLPDFIGRGWGKYLLTQAVEAGWNLNPTRVWLHTCTLDHPAALPNYVKRGFRPVRQETYTVSG